MRMDAIAACRGALDGGSRIAQTGSFVRVKSWPGYDKPSSRGSARRLYRKLRHGFPVVWIVLQLSMSACFLLISFKSAGEGCAL